jgi:hypothetical protein
MSTFEITEVETEYRTWEAKKGPAAGQEFHSYNVTAKGPDGELRDYEITRKPSSGPPPLGVVEAEVKPSNGNFPDKLKLTPQGRSGGSSDKDDYWRRKDERDIESQARMGRAHAQEMAIRTIALKGVHSDTYADNEAIKVTLREWTDWFHQDVQRFPLDADASGGSRSDMKQARSGARGLPVAALVDPAGVSAKVGFVSEKQRNYYERLLNGPRASEWGNAEKATVTRYLQQTDRATVRAAIDALSGGSEAEVAGLLREATDWASKQSDVPWNEEGLPPA